MPAAGPGGSRRKQVTAAATLSVAAILTASLTAAHAGPAPTGTGPAVQAAATKASIAPVQASAGASISYERPAVTTEQAPVPAPAKAQVAAAGTAAPKAVAAAPVASSARLGAPLASMSVASPFGIRSSPISGSGELHTGLDLVAACQTAVFAAGAGTVVEAGWSAYGGGNRIVVDHGNGLKSTYNHLASIETAVGATVTAGQRLAAAGTTGASTGCHLHFEVLLNGQTVNPQGWI
ncbi:MULTISPECIES: M23 family metallopeptidase [Paenarthrobacter]|uniref:M23 family metallopeptidase n=1 Tax=Paenarthrobacter ureafaciens TaxID=37931 RepID=A0AAX3EKG4_PAEUR|nr:MULTISPECIES: M23 family metallopeptidase [Paenarthrobacter]UYV93483.1 M23 family metallopeptidase [Paenarthrobacter ureafaciens]UYV98012.1 M23 family metallopeptidase [Paenarthrobacter ureafaciens]WIV29329.1 M23 family metallopeptidase [Paenarthrobacter sp. R1]